MKKSLGKAGAALGLSRILPKPIATDRQVMLSKSSGLWAKSAPNSMFQASEGTCQSVPNKGLISRRAAPATPKISLSVGDGDPKLLSSFDSNLDMDRAPAHYADVERLGVDLCKYPIHAQYAALACQSGYPPTASIRELRFRELLIPVYDALKVSVINASPTEGVEINSTKNILNKHVSAISQSLVFLDSLDRRSGSLSITNMLLDCMYTVCQKDLNPLDIREKIIPEAYGSGAGENLENLFNLFFRDAIDKNGHLHPKEVIESITRFLGTYTGVFHEDGTASSTFCVGLQPPSAEQLKSLKNAVDAGKEEAAEVFNTCVKEMVVNVNFRNIFNSDSYKSHDPERPFPFNYSDCTLDPHTAKECKSYAREFRFKHNLFKSGENNATDLRYRDGIPELPWMAMQGEVKYLCNYLGREVPPVFQSPPPKKGSHNASDWATYADLVDQLDLLYVQADKKILTSIFGTFDTKLKEAQKACETRLLSQVLDFSEFISNKGCSLVQNLRLGGEGTKHINLVYPGEYTKRQMSANERLLRETTFVFGILGNGMGNLMQDGKEQAFVDMNNSVEDAKQLLALLGFAGEDINKSFALDTDYGGRTLGIGTVSRSSQGLNALGQGELADGILDICEINAKDTNIRETFYSRARKIGSFLTRPSHVSLGLTVVAAALTLVASLITLAVGPVGFIVPATLVLGFGLFALILATGLTLSQLPFIPAILGAFCGSKSWWNNRKGKKYTDLLKRVMNGNEKAIAIYKQRKDYSDDKTDTDFIRAEAAKEYVSIIGDSAVPRMMKKAKNRLIKLGKNTNYYRDNVRNRGSSTSKTDLALLSIRDELCARETATAGARGATIKLDGILGNNQMVQDDYTTPYSALKEIVALAAATTQEDFLLTSEPSSASRKRQFIENIAKVGKALLPDNTALQATTTSPLPNSPTVSPQDIVPLKLQLLWQLQGIIATSKGPSCIKSPMPAE